MWKLRKTKDVDDTFSNEPQTNSMKPRINPKDPACRAKIAKHIVEKKRVVELVDAIRRRGQQGREALNLCTIRSTIPSTGADPISASVVRDSLDLSKGGVLERDGSILTEASWTQLEHQFTHHLKQGMAVAHALTLRGSVWEQKEVEFDAKIKKVQADLKKAEEALALAREEIAQKDQKLAVLTKEVDDLKSSEKQQFEVGKRKGREDFLESNDFQSMLKKAHQDGVCNFKKSPEFVVLNNVVDHVKAAYNICQTELQKLGNLNECSEVTKLDVVKTENLEEYSS